MGEIINWSKRLTDYPEVETATTMQFHAQGGVRCRLFILAALVTGMVAFIMMYSQSYKTARTNPVRSLKGE